jgi:hypothetical protein
MKSGPKTLPNAPYVLWQDRATGLFLFLATAAVVIWQNLRLASLWDLSYILGTSHRISLSDLPYRDLLLYYPTLTFLIQAGFPFLRGLLTGTALVVPTFIKQKCGPGFLASTGLAFATLTGLEAWRPFLGTRR